MNCKWQIANGKLHKYGILDVKVHTVSGSIVHVEIQLRVIPELKERTIFSQSKLVTEQMASGNKYSIIKRVVSIIITDENFVTGNCYHHQFRYRTVDGTEFTNLVEINTLELSKLPQNTDSTELWYWMKFIKSDDEEVFDMLAKRNPQMRKAIGVLKELSADERIRMLYERREMARMDMASMVDGARAEGHAEGHAEGRADVARSLLKMKLPIEQIVTATGLTHEEVEALHES